MEKHWSEVFGNYVSAATVVEMGGEDLEAFLKEIYFAMYWEYPEPAHVRAWTEQIVREAEESTWRNE